MVSKESAVSYILSCFRVFSITPKELDTFLKIFNINHMRKKQARAYGYVRVEQARVYIHAYAYRHIHRHTNVGKACPNRGGTAFKPSRTRLETFFKPFRDFIRFKSF